MYILHGCVLSASFLTLQLIHTATPDMTQTGLFCRVRCGGVNWVGQTAKQVRFVSERCRGVSGAVRPPGALRRRTHLSGGQFTPPHQTRPDCRPPPRHGPGRQLRLAARLPTRSDVVHHAKCKHAVDCCIWLNLNFFTKRYATRVIYRLTVQTWPDIVSRLNSHRLTRQTVLSCLAGGVKWALKWWWRRHGRRAQWDVAHRVFAYCMGSGYNIQFYLNKS